METQKSAGIVIETHVLASIYLDREVTIDVYLPDNIFDIGNISLLLINDGQDLPKMQAENSQFLQFLPHPTAGFENILLENFEYPISLMCVGIHCGVDRKNEYGTKDILDYKGLGTKAAAYQQFVLEELMPFIRQAYSISSFKEKSFCGFSLGALSALDIVWNNPEEFSKVGLFSGSLWWRTVSQDDEMFDENIHRIMHMKIRNGNYYPWLKFFFETGTQDETADRNGNGIIDTIDDTISLIDELVLKGYNKENDIKYLELKDGRHDVATWAKAFPEFLQWGWGSEL